MNRREALDILDRLHPDDLDASDEPEVRTARDVVTADPALHRTWKRRAAFDRRATELMADVAVPDDLHARLLGSLGLGTLTPSDIGRESAEGPPTRRIPRRAWLRGALAASLVGAAGGIAWWWSGRTALPAPTTFDYARRAAQRFDDVRHLSVFTGDFQPVLPMSGWQPPAILVAQPPRSLALAHEDAPAAAVYEFHVRRAGRSYRGLLVAAPTAWFETPPAERFFEQAAQSYVEPYATVAWREQELTYICVADLETLRILDSTLAVRSA